LFLGPESVGSYRIGLPLGFERKGVLNSPDGEVTSVQPVGLVAYGTTLNVLLRVRLDRFIRNKW
jgi:hypothetical protein